MTSQGQPTDRTEGQSRRPRVLWVNQFAVAPSEGGGTRHFEMGRELAALGWDVTIAASDLNLQSRRYSRRRDSRDRRPIEELIDGVRFLWLWSAPYETNNWRRGWNWLSFSKSVLELRRREHWDVVIGSSPHLFAAAAGCRLARRLRVPFVFEVRDLWPESLVAAGGRRGPFYLLLSGIARFLYARADRLVVLARGAGDYLVQTRGVDEARVVFIPNGVDPTAFRDGSGSGDGETVFIYAGAHGAANGLEVVLDAAARVQDCDDIRFRLIGDGPSKRGLQSRAGQLGLTNVEFRDPIPKSEIPQAFAEADAALMILRDAPLFRFAVSPNKLFDYFAAGLPVISNVPGEVGDMVRDADAGLNVPPADPVSLALAVRRMAGKRPEWRTNHGENGRAWVAREHSRPLLADRLDRTLRAAMEGA